MNWKAFYTRFGNVFGMQGQGYSAAGHRGTDVIGVPRGTAVPAYRAGKVTKIQRSAFLGRVVVVKADADGLYDGYAHLQDVVKVVIGQPVNAGDGLGYVAGAIDSPGSSWDGAHCHITCGPSNESIFTGTVYDPQPKILDAISRAVVSNTWAYMEPTGDLAKQVQQELKNKKRYSGPVDGVFGVATRKGVQLTLNNSRIFVGLIDGKILGGGCKGIQLYAQKFGKYTGPIDSKLGLNSWAGFARGLKD